MAIERERNKQTELEAANLKLFKQLLNPKYLNENPESEEYQKDLSDFKDNVKEIVATYLKEINFVEVGKDKLPKVPTVTYENDKIKFGKYVINNVDISTVIDPEERKNPKALLLNQYIFNSAILGKINEAIKIEKTRDVMVVNDKGETFVQKLDLAKRAAENEKSLSEAAQREASIKSGVLAIRTVTPREVLKSVKEYVPFEINEKRVSEAKYEADIREYAADNIIESLDYYIEDNDIQERGNYLGENLDVIVKNKPELVKKYAALSYEYDEFGNPRNAEGLAKIIDKLKQENKDDPNVDTINENIAELENELYSRAIIRSYNKQIALTGNDNKAFENILNEIGKEKFESMIPRIELHLEQRILNISAANLNPQYNFLECQEAVDRLTPTVNKYNEEKDVISPDALKAFQEKIDKIADSQIKIDNQSQKVKEELEKQKDIISKIKDRALKTGIITFTKIDNSQRSKDDHSTHEDNSTRNSNNVINNNKTTNKNKSTTNITNNYYYENKNKDDDEPSQGEPGPQGSQGEKGEPGKDGGNGRDGNDGNNGNDGNDGRNGKDGKDGKNPEPVEPISPKVEPVTIVEPVDDPNKEPIDPIVPDPKPYSVATPINETPKEKPKDNPEDNNKENPEETRDNPDDTTDTRTNTPADETQKSQNEFNNSGINGSNNNTTIININGPVNVIEGDVNTDNSVHTNIDNSQNYTTDVRNYNVIVVTQDGQKDYILEGEDLDEKQKAEIITALEESKGKIKEYMSRETHEELIDKMLDERNKKLYEDRIEMLEMGKFTEEQAKYKADRMLDVLESGDASTITFSESQKEIINESDIEIENMDNLTEEEFVDLCAKYEFLNSKVIENEKERIEVIIKRSTELQVKITKMKDPKTMEQLDNIDKQRGVVREAEYEVVDENEPKQIEGNEQLYLTDGQDNPNIDDDDMMI